MRRLLSSMRPGRANRGRPSLEYQTLRPSQIRLLSFANPKGELTLQDPRLKLEHFELDAAPPYLALSYVWGDASDTEAIPVNGAPFPATKNLYTALMHLRGFSPWIEAGIAKGTGKRATKMYLWVDAICINQNDLNEKSREVARMSDIYASAYTALVWLGPLGAFDPDLAAFNHLIHIFHITCPVTLFERPVTNIEGAVGTGPQDAAAIDPDLNIIPTYASLLLNQWFERVWVVQEYCLSQREVVVLLGPAMFSLEAIYGLGPNLSQVLNHEDARIRHEIAGVAATTMGLVEVAFGPVYTPTYLNSEAFRSTSVAEQLLWLLMNLGSRHASLPQDNIYGLLGMIDVTKLPRSLLPDYRLPYAEVFEAYSRFIFDETKDLRLLLSSVPGDLGTVPSWVADFRHHSPWTVPPEVRHAGGFSTDGRVLHVEAVKMGTVIRYFDKPADGEHESELQRFYDSMILASAAITNETSTVVWRKWWHYFFTTCHEAQQSVCSLALASQSPADFLEDLRSMYQHTRDTALLLLQFASQEYFLLDDGQIAKHVRSRTRVPANCERDSHQVWAVKGAAQRCVLVEGQKDCYTYEGWITEVDVKLDAALFASHTSE